MCCRDCAIATRSKSMSTNACPIDLMKTTATAVLAESVIALEASAVARERLFFIFEDFDRLCDGPLAFWPVIFAEVLAASAGLANATVSVTALFEGQPNREGLPASQVACHLKGSQIAKDCPRCKSPVIALRCAS